MNLGDITNGTTLALALGSNVLWLLAFIVSTAVKRYAAQRDFNHLRNNLKQMGEAIALFDKHSDSRFDDLDKALAEIKAYISIHVSSSIRNKD